MSAEREYEVDASKPDLPATAIKAAADAYIAGMDAATARTSPLVDLVGERVQGLPDGVRGRLGEGSLFLSGVLFTFTDGEGKQFSCEVGLDSFKCCACCFGHGPEPTEGAV